MNQTLVVEQKRLLLMPSVAAARGGQAKEIKAFRAIRIRLHLKSQKEIKTVLA